MLALKIKKQVAFHNLQKLHQQHQGEISTVMNKVLLSGVYTKGEYTQRFERNFSKFIGCKHCIGVSNQLDALKIIIKSYITLGQLKKGDTIIVPHNSSNTTKVAITEAGLVPILVPSLLDPHTIEEHFIQKNTTAIFLVHFNGSATYNEALDEFIKKFKLLVLEDNSQAVGAFYKDKKTGNLGAATGLSFSPNKSLGGLGNDGAILTNDDQLALLIQNTLSQHSNDKYNSFNELQAAILGVKLKYLNAHNQFKTIIAKRYLKHIQNIHIALPTIEKDCTSIWHSFVIRTLDRDSLQVYLQNHGVTTVPNSSNKISDTTDYAKLNHQSLSIITRLKQESLSLPIDPVMHLHEVDYVIGLINKFRPSI
jgi:dTDP-4-amino-4,6-dideoxygalactose transaminase